ncbi:MAG TPA: CoA transferase [Acidimicrobiales bacterium]|nr:CoA transferase [Acidimicrobiales bacterium]
MPSDEGLATAPVRDGQPAPWTDRHQLVPSALAALRLDALAEDINEHLRGHRASTRIVWESMVAVRATLLDLRPPGRTSANGSCRLCRTLDGWVAVNLARPVDANLFGALIGQSMRVDPWPEVERYASTCTTSTLVADARLLGLPVSPLAGPRSPTRPCEIDQRWPPGPQRKLSEMRVVDLSAMWAGPLAAKILASAGAEVVKVESRARPDGARAVPAFYRWLHPDDQCTEVLDFADPAGRQRLRSLLESADVVIEASRPRALEQLGVDADAVAPRAGRIWLSITGYGRREPGRDWVAFGDDAAVAGGLVGRDPAGDPVFVGDAIADPVSGLFGALAVLDAAGSGGGQLIDLAMSRCAGALAAPG